MIFVTYGTQPHNFKFMGELVNQIDGTYQVQVQLGESENNISRTDTKINRYLPDFDHVVSNSEIIITHGGVGSIMSGLLKGKKVIAISRLAEFGEHVDNHQLEVTTKLAKDQYIYHLQRDEDINKVLEQVINTEFKKYQSNTINFVNNIEKILRSDF